ANPDTLIGPNATNTWYLTGPGVGSVAGVSFRSIENLTGGSQNDTFNLGPASGNYGKITGGGFAVGGADTVNLVRDADFSLTNTVLTASDGTSATLAAITVANLTGGASASTFDVSGWTGTGSLNGGGGTDMVVVNKNANMTLSDTKVTDT